MEPCRIRAQGVVVVIQMIPDPDLGVNPCGPVKSDYRIENLPGTPLSYRVDHDGGDLVAFCDLASITWMASAIISCRVRLRLSRQHARPDGSAQAQQPSDTDEDRRRRIGAHARPVV